MLVLSVSLVTLLLLCVVAPLFLVVTPILVPFDPLNCIVVPLCRCLQSLAYYCLLDLDRKCADGVVAHSRIPVLLLMLLCFVAVSTCFYLKLASFFLIAIDVAHVELATSLRLKVLPKIGRAHV